VRNVRAVKGKIPHVELFQQRPDLTVVMPFMCFVAAYDAARTSSDKLSSRAIVTRYLGPSGSCANGC